MRSERDDWQIGEKGSWVDTSPHEGKSSKGKMAVTAVVVQMIDVTIHAQTP